MKLNYFTIIILLIGLILSQTAFAADEGSHAAEFLSHGVGARALGMGSAFVAIADDSTATYWNPAGMTNVENNSFSAMYSDTFGSSDGSFITNGLVNYNFVNYVHQIEGIGSLGLSWIRLGVDDIPRTTFIDIDNNGRLGDYQDINGNGEKDTGEPYIDRPTVAGYFSNTDNALLISYARNIQPVISVGGSVKLLKQSIFDYSGSGFGIDIGFMFTPYKGLRLGTMLLDATGTQIRWNTADKPIFTRGRRIRLGGAYQFAFNKIGNGSISADIETDQADYAENNDSGGGVIYRTGVEFWLFNTLALRTGWNGHGLSLGSGLQLTVSTMTFFVDYAFNSHTLGGSQRISVSGQF
ncbi:PorV/PorQ family protein [Candidatus Poribacteria bacterium]|nr:PorV/PorQ family protein [Candidatus Poribacteria bacterium]